MFKNIYPLLRKNGKNLDYFWVVVSIILLINSIVGLVTSYIGQAADSKEQISALGIIFTSAITLLIPLAIIWVIMSFVYNRIQNKPAESAAASVVPDQSNQAVLTTDRPRNFWDFYPIILLLLCFGMLSLVLKLDMSMFGVLYLFLGLVCLILFPFTFLNLFKTKEGLQKIINRIATVLFVVVFLLVIFAVTVFKGGL
ncbi:MAG: hypothetical protein WCO55_01515 [Candidatus Falkowbacteria bacterium]